jgi:alpha-glucosidase
MEAYEQRKRRQMYLLGTRPLLDIRAMFSDGTQDYRRPAEPEKNSEVTLRFRARCGNLDQVFLIHEEVWTPMRLVESDPWYDFFEICVQLGESTYSYCFGFHDGGQDYFYERGGFAKQYNPKSLFEIIPGFHTPDWAKGAVMYQIFTDRFANGDPSNDVENREYIYIGEPVERVTDWERLPGTMDVRAFYGGDLQGVWDKLDYLQDLGVQVIYFNPLFVSPSNHKYDIQDYDYIDPHFGKIVEDTGEPLPEGAWENAGASMYINRVSSKANLEASNRFFAKLVEEIHARGMKVILDGVFNHCGSFNKWLDRERIYEKEEAYPAGAFVSQDSPYRSFFRFYETRWPYNTSYDGWWGHDTLPKLNYEGSETLKEYMLDIGRKWVSPPYNADGWRLDVAADLGHSEDYNHQFWREFRNAVKEANPEAIILAEHYGNAKAWLGGDQWDTVMNYDAFMEPVTWFFTGMEKHSDDYRGERHGNGLDFRNAMTYHMMAFNTPSLQVAMNELSNHDHSRFLTRTNGKVGRLATLGSHAAEEGVRKSVLREAVVVQMTWPGAPTIYYGDEAGVCGFTDPDSRRTYPWGHEDQELIAFHKDIIRVHREHGVFATGSVKFIHCDYQLLTYGRFNREEQILVAVNNQERERKISLPVWEIGAETGEMYRLFESWSNGYTTSEKCYPIQAGYVNLTLGGYSALVLKRR